MNRPSRAPFNAAARKRANALSVFSLALTGAAIVTTGGVYVGYQMQPHETVTATVVDKERMPEGSKYLVYTDKEVFENSDTMWQGKWNSSDLQGALVRGCEYELKVKGFRNNFLSIYRNVLSADHIPTESCPSVPKPGVR